MIKVVFLDIDNTLLSFSGYVKDTMRKGFSQFNLCTYTDDMFDVFERVNNGLWRQIERGELTFEQLEKVRWNKVFAELSINFDGVAFEKYFRASLFDNAIPEPYANEILDYLSQKYVLCAASNGPYEQQLNRLRVGRMYDCFTHFFISSQVGAQKPAPEFFDYCFNALRASGMPDITPQQTIIIGDSMTSDMAGGRQYGMHTCLYRKDASQRTAPDGVDYVVSHLAEIEKIL